MKILHCADIHLGSIINSFNEQVNQERKDDVLKTFMSLISYAESQDIHHILLSGDVFDNDHPSERDYLNVKSIFDAHKDITFYYLKGNHDQNNDYFSSFENVKLFNKEWSYYYLNDDIVISGLELDYDQSHDQDHDQDHNYIYDNLVLDQDKINIVMLHGDLNKDINLHKLAKKGVDYLALGHIHAGNICHQDDMIYAYPGCLEGRGFDELGPKGFIELNIENSKIVPKFIPLSSRLICIEPCDISHTHSDYDVINAIKALNLNNQDIYRIELKGSINYELSLDLIKSKLASLNVYYCEIKNSTVKNINYQEYLEDISLTGAFTREAIKIEDESLKHLVSKTHLLS